MNPAQAGEPLSWAATFDLLQHEYGWTPDYVLGHVTPRQARLWVEAIDRRRRRELAMTAQAMRLAFGGAFHKDGARAFGRFVEMLLRDDAASSDLPGRPVEEAPPEPTADEEKAALLRRALKIKRQMQHGEMG